MSNTITQLFGAAVWLAVSMVPLQAAAETVLTVTHDGAATEYDLAALESLGAVTFETTTVWTEGTQSFTGVPLATLAMELDVDDGVFLASAINDYTIEIPVTDAVDGGPIIAFLNNGAPMSVRDKGPLWIVYPYDSSPEYQAEQIYARSIWQLDRIETKN